MLHQNSVFHGLLKHVPWHKFEQAVEKHDADALSRKLDTKRHFIALLYGQMSGATSLREVVTGMASQGGMFTGMKVTPITILVALLIAAVVGFASTFVPSYHAAKVNIVDGLRHIG